MEYDVLCDIPTLHSSHVALSKVSMYGTLAALTVPFGSKSGCLSVLFNAWSESLRGLLYHLQPGIHYSNPAQQPESFCCWCQGSLPVHNLHPCITPIMTEGGDQIVTKVLVRTHHSHKEH
jgi:hypothetical protein